LLLVEALAVLVYSANAFQVLHQRCIGDEQAVQLVAEGAVDAGQRLHQQRALQGAVKVQRVQRRRVEASEPRMQSLMERYLDTQKADEHRVAIH
jgi:hypothetical protein